ncbi:MAG TPA: hypothetical protein VD770_02505 [Coxiellaceae bacterium]|nr:hypothetical protein [Coxiellaceae bacterium]
MKQQLAIIATEAYKNPNAVLTLLHKKIDSDSDSLAVQIANKGDLADPLVEILSNLLHSIPYQNDDLNKPYLKLLLELAGTGQDAILQFYKKRMRYFASLIDYFFYATRPAFSADSVNDTQAIIPLLIEKGCITSSTVSRTEHNCRMILKAITELKDISEAYDLLAEISNSAEVSNPETSLGQFFGFNHLSPSTFFLVENYFNSVVQLRARGLSEIRTLNLLISAKVNIEGKESPLLHYLCLSHTGKRYSDFTLQCINLLADLAKETEISALLVKEFLETPNHFGLLFGQHILGVYSRELPLLDKLVDLYQIVKLPLTRETSTSLFEIYLPNCNAYAPLLLRIIKIGLISPELITRSAQYKGAKLAIKNALLHEAEKIPAPEAKLLLEAAIDPKTPLGQFFWTSGYEDCLISINARLTELKGNAVTDTADQENVVVDAADHGAQETKLDKPTSVSNATDNPVTALLNSTAGSLLSAVTGAGLFGPAPSKGTTLTTDVNDPLEITADGEIVIQSHRDDCRL